MQCVVQGIAESQKCQDHVIPADGIRVVGGGANNQKECIRKIRKKYPQSSAIVYNSETRKCGGFLFYTSTKPDPKKFWTLCTFQTKFDHPLQDGGKAIGKLKALETFTCFLSALFRYGKKPDYYSG